MGEVLNTFFLVYAFATPVGAVLTRHLLIEETHRVPRILAVVALVSVVLGMVL